VAIRRIACGIVVATLAAPASAEPLKISFEDALAMAVRSSNLLVAARADVEQARADVRAARASFLPQITLGGSYVRTLDTEFDAFFSAPDPGAMTVLPTLPFGRDHTWRATLDATQVLWDGRRTASAVDLAKSSRDLAELGTHSQLAQTLLAVAEAYLAVVLADRVVAIGERSLEFAQRTYDEARLGFDQGTRSEFEVLRAEVSREQERAVMVRARGARDLALVRLRKQLGIPLDRPLVLTSGFEREDVARAAREALGIAGDVTERVAVAQARANVAAARAQLGQARADLWPQLTAFTSFGYVQYPDGFVPDGDWLRNWTVGVNLSFPLFTGFRVTAQIRGARASVAAAEARLTEAAQLAAVDERRLGIDMAVAEAVLRENLRNVRLAERAHAIAEVRYRQGISTQLELADARLALDRAQIGAAIAARDLQVARVREALLPALPNVEGDLPLPAELTGGSQLVVPATPTPPQPVRGPVIPGTLRSQPR
jgi:outer membrane protein